MERTGKARKGIVKNVAQISCSNFYMYNGKRSLELDFSIIISMIALFSKVSGMLQFLMSS